MQIKYLYCFPGPVETRALIGAARSSFSKLLDKIGQQFPCISLQPMAGLPVRSSLIRILGRGLSQAMVGKSFKDKQSLMSSQVRYSFDPQ